MTFEAMRSGLLLLAGLACVVVLAGMGAPWWMMILVAFAQVAVIVLGSLGLGGGSKRRLALGVIALFLLGLVLLPVLTESTSPLEVDPHWRIPQPEPAGVDPAAEEASEDE